MLKKIKSVAIFTPVAMVVLVILFIFFQEKSATVDKIMTGTKTIIDYPSEFNYRQTVNDCGPFNTAAVVRALTKQSVDSNVFAKEIGWRLPTMGTLPWGLEKQLKEQGIVAETPNVKSLSDADKVLFLQEKLLQKMPIIILGEKNEYEHYLTIFGFDTLQGEFYVYDSWHDKDVNDGSLTKDDNGGLPGNRTLSSRALLEFWRGGGMFGVHTWYALVASAE